MDQRIATEKRSGLLDAFTEHPASVGETYFEHMAFALKFSGKLFLAGGAAFVHAFLPFCFEKTGSNLIKAMYAKVANRG